MLDFTGITNQNEFYFDHYLTHLMEEDLKDLFARWNRAEDAARNPRELLRALAGKWHGRLRQYREEKDPARRLQLLRELAGELLAALGYELSPCEVLLKEGDHCPVVAGIWREDRTPALWVLEALHDDPEEEKGPLGAGLSSFQQKEIDKSLVGIRYEELLSRQIFSLEAPPRWVILYDHAELVLAERGKWAEKRVLRFDLEEIFTRREPSTLGAMAALLHRESLCPGEGIPLLDSLNEKSHQHAFGVSRDLKYALRECIEILGNEAIRYLREVRKIGLYGEQGLDAEDLTRECLRYMYRLLFLFYIEARPELGYVPRPSRMLSEDPYWSGYSLESLRDLEMTPLVSEEARQGTFIGDSLALLFELIYKGFAEEKAVDLFAAQESRVETFRMTPLASHLFDPERTPILNRVRFRNEKMQRILQRMSLSTMGSGRRRRRGRISYAQLGINQLGAVYEALLSYTGFFAEQDLYEVRRVEKAARKSEADEEDDFEAEADSEAGEGSAGKGASAGDELEIGYFVGREDLGRFEEAEIVRDESTGRALCYPKGTFIYRLAGRDRQRSASYYTPEVLTTCLVKYALRELLEGKTADVILELTVCEPAMGSAAFLNEAVNQLAEAYLQRKQKETGLDIPLERYAHERQRVKMYLADNNVYGVDLNPVAVELAEVSLWLNTIFAGAQVPWFGMQLACGNSLIGCRRIAYPADRLRKGASEPWFEGRGRRLPLGEPFPERQVWHFLLPDPGMAHYPDKVVKAMEPEAIRKITAWRKEFCSPFESWQIDELVGLAAQADRMWQSHARQEQEMRRRTTDPLTVWGQPPAEGEIRSTAEKDRIFESEMHNLRVQAAGMYRRLKLVMDYWCALWFWPIDQADLLPTRDQFLFECHAILVGGPLQERSRQQSLFPTTVSVQQSLRLFDDFGFVNLDDMLEQSARLRLVETLSKRYRFLHWELEFADLFLSRGGFDLILGNPPWIKVEWQEGGVMGDADPFFVIRKHSAPELARLRDEALRRTPGLRAGYLAEYQESAGTKNYLNALVNYSELKGQQTNLYKCFLPMSWAIAE